MERSGYHASPLAPVNRAFLKWVLAVLATGLIAASGCTRERYYRQANQEVQALVQEKSDDPRWALPNFTVEMDPRSRFYDPCDPVRPPMPPDDPAAHRFMHCVDAKRGWPHWHRWGTRTTLENPEWRQRLSEYVEVTPEGEVHLTLPAAVTIAYINSPSYQQQLETIYLSALDVSTERFRFDVQFFGGNDTTFVHQGRLRTPAGEQNTLTTETDFQLRRRLATAGELLVGFANSFVWQFAGPDTNATLSILNFNLVQPLLRGAGRDVALEQLTIAERALLANLRAFQRYRQGMYTLVAIGELGVTGPQRRGGFFGGTGLTGFTGTGSAGFGGVGEATGFGRTGFAGGGGGAGAGGVAGFAGGGAGQVGGFIGLLQQYQQIRNTRESLNAQLRTLRLLEAYLQAGTIDLTQVDQFRQSIESERANLLQAQNSLEGSLDSFKTGTLGVAPDLPVRLDTEMIRRFQFIDPQMSGLQNRLSDAIEEFGRLPMAPEPTAIQQTLKQTEELVQAARQAFAQVEEDLRALAEKTPERTRHMDPAEAQTFAKEMQRLRETFAALQKRFEPIPARLEVLAAQLRPETRQKTADQLVDLMTAFATLIDELSLVQARARLEVVTITPVRITAEQALRIARANRLDWMNNRASLVDTWRLIQFNADALQSNVTVGLSGDMRTVGDNPLNFRAPTGTLRASVQFDAPFTRLLERNNFRQVLIDYQQARRQLIQFEDAIHQTLRSRLRQLEQLRVNLEIQRRAVIIAIRRVDQTRDVLNEPPPPPEPGKPATQLGPTAALNLLTALSDLRSSQNNFMSVWLNYYATRMQLERDMGIMELDERGLWIEEPWEVLDDGQPEAYPLPPPVPDELLRKLNPEGPNVQDHQRLAPPPAGPAGLDPAKDGGP